MAIVRREESMEVEEECHFQQPSNSNDRLGSREDSGAAFDERSSNSERVNDNNNNNSGVAVVGNRNPASSGVIQAFSEPCLLTGLESLERSTTINSHQKSRKTPVTSIITSATEIPLARSFASIKVNSSVKEIEDAPTLGISFDRVGTSTSSSSSDDLKKRALVSNDSFKSCLISVKEDLSADHDNDNNNNDDDGDGDPIHSKFDSSKQRISPPKATKATTESIYTATNNPMHYHTRHISISASSSSFADHGGSSAGANKSVSFDAPLSSNQHRHVRSSSFPTPMARASSYSSCSPSPAVSFLSQLAESSYIDSKSQANNELDQGDVVGDYVLGKIIGHGSFSLVRECWKNCEINSDAANTNGDSDDKGQQQFINRSYSSLKEKSISSGSSSTDAFFEAASNSKSNNSSSSSGLAAKIVRNNGGGNSLEEDSAFQLFEKELSIWRNLKHENILPLKDVIDLEHWKIAVMPMVIRGTLFQKIIKEGALPESLAKSLFLQLARAMFYLHEEASIVHRDIKLENILLDTDAETMADHLYLSDFGLAEYFPRNHYSCSAGHNHNEIANGGTNGDSGGGNDVANSNFTSPLGYGSSSTMSPCLSPGTPHLLPLPSSASENSESKDNIIAGTVAYCSPEKLDSSSESGRLVRLHRLPQPDIWSLGVVLYSMVAGHLPFDDDYIPRLQMAIRKGEYDPLPTTLSPQLIDLVSKMLAVDWRQRICIRQVLEHPWLKIN